MQSLNVINFNKMKEEL
jgi:hypothetical protein